jgi:hypothetical protein
MTWTIGPIVCNPNPDDRPHDKDDTCVGRLLLFFLARSFLGEDYGVEEESPLITALPIAFIRGRPITSYLSSCLR